MHYCLSKKHTEKLIDNLFSARQIDDDYKELQKIIEEAENWSGEISILNYLLTQILEKKLKKKIDCKPLIEFIYRLTDNMWLSLQEFDADYINAMFDYPRGKNLSLEEILIEIQDKIGNHDYERFIRS